MATNLPTHLETLAAPDRGVDAEIWETIGLDESHEGHCKDWCASGGRSLPRRTYLEVWSPEFTASVDAAMTLIPNGLYWTLGAGKTRADEPLYGAQVFKPGNDQPIAEAETDCSAAAALCAAALRAVAAGGRGR